MSSRRWLALPLLFALPVALLAGRDHVPAGSAAGAEHETLFYRGSTGCGVERWHVKTGTDSDRRRVNLNRLTPTSIIHLRSLPAPSDLPPDNRIGATETTVFKVTGYLLRFKEEQDSDYHLVLADSGGRTMIAEIPAPDCVGQSSPFLSRITTVRKQFDRRYRVTPSWRRFRVPVTVAGVGFFDFKHGQSGVAPNAIELHPVLSIAFGSRTT